MFGLTVSLELPTLLEVTAESTISKRRPITKIGLTLKHLASFSVMKVNNYLAIFLNNLFRFCSSHTGTVKFENYQNWSSV